MPFDIDAIRAQFPALSLQDHGKPRIYLDNPGGTQVSRFVVERMTQCLIGANANLGGPFATSIEAGRIVERARSDMADFFHASPDEIVFGQNMTSLTFQMSRALGRRFQPGDEIVVTRMDHDGNVAPWLLLARDRGLVVKWLDFDPVTFAYDLASLDDMLTPATRLVAVNHASNATGTINDVAAVAAKARAAGALTYVDAVQYAPHLPIDVEALGCDVLVASAYKFFGPHQGVMWGRRALLEEIEAYKVRPAPEEPPEKFETGTQSHEGLAGVSGAIDYFRWVGETMAAPSRAQRPGLPGPTATLHAALDVLAEHERRLTGRLIQGLKALKRVRIIGVSEENRLSERVPTVSITIDGHAPSAVNRALAADNIFAWDGHNYALEAIRRLGLEDRGGVLRLGLAHYNTEAEVDRVLDAIEHAIR
jgi:cysteine desulfurase family protein (TIGR01976 family)